MPLLSESARHVVFPPTIVETNWPIIERRLADMGVVYDPWQRGLASLVLGVDADGQYAATVGGVVLSIPRQVGKTFFVLTLLVALCLEYPGLQVVWTSHHLRTSTRTFQTMQGIVRRSKVAPFVAYSGIRVTNGEQEVKFKNGSKFMFGARRLGFGRGFDEIDVEVFDEAQILDSKSLEDMVAATNQARHEHGALLFFMGTPPTELNPSEEFGSRRTKALSGEAEDMVYVEASADPDADPDDRAQWAKANPSYPARTPLQSMLRLRANLRDDGSWMREGLGVWNPANSHRVIPQEFWDLAGDDFSIPVDRFALGVEVAEDMKTTSVSLAGQRLDGSWHVELEDNKEGAAWVVPHIKNLLANNPQLHRAVVVDVFSPAKTLLDEFEAAKIKVTAIRVNELGSACSRFLEGIVSCTLRHNRQTQMAVAASVAGKRKLGDTGMWVWNRATATSDITPIQSATLALWGAQATTVKRPARKATSERRAVLL